MESFQTYLGFLWQHKSSNNSSVERSNYITSDLTLTLAARVYDFTWVRICDSKMGDGVWEFFRTFRSNKGSVLDGKHGQFEIIVTKLNIKLRYLRSRKNPD